MNNLYFKWSPQFNNYSTAIKNLSLVAVLLTTNNINPSCVYDVPQPKSYTLIPRIHANSSINSG